MLVLQPYLVTDSAQCQRAGRGVVETVQQAAAGGVGIVQLREKNASGRDFLALVQAVSAVLPAHVPLLVNDRIDVFLAARAAGVRVDGVHIGQSEIPAPLVRQIIGPEAVLGLSANTTASVSEAEGWRKDPHPKSHPKGHQKGHPKCIVDYLGIGPLHDTATKADAQAGKGLEALRALRQLSALPAVAIGGITAADLPALRAAGFDGAAVVSAICAAADAQQATEALVQAWGGAA